MTTAQAIAAREARLRERNRPVPTRRELEAMLVADLRILAEVRGVPTSGTKAVLVDRLAWR